MGSVILFTANVWRTIRSLGSTNVSEETNEDLNERNNLSNRGHWRIRRLRNVRSIHKPVLKSCYNPALSLLAQGPTGRHVIGAAPGGIVRKDLSAHSEILHSGSVQTTEKKSHSHTRHIFHTVRLVVSFAATSQCICRSNAHASQDFSAPLLLSLLWCSALIHEVYGSICVAFRVNPCCTYNSCTMI